MSGEVGEIPGARLQGIVSQLREVVEGAGAGQQLDIQGVRRIFDVLLPEIVNLQHTVANLQADRVSVCSLSEALYEQLDALSQQNAALDDQLRRVTAQLREQAGRIVALGNVVQQRDQEINRLQANMNALTQTCQDLRQSLNVTQRSLQITLLQKRLVEVTAQIDRIQKEAQGFNPVSASMGATAVGVVLLLSGVGALFAVGGAVAGAATGGRAPVVEQAKARQPELDGLRREREQILSRFRQLGIRC